MLWESMTIKVNKGLLIYHGDHCHAPQVMNLIRITQFLLKDPKRFKAHSDLCEGEGSFEHDSAKYLSHLKTYSQEDDLSDGMEVYRQ
jgi:hypothetical protein